MRAGSVLNAQRTTLAKDDLHSIKGKRRGRSTLRLVDNMQFGGDTG